MGKKIVTKTVRVIETYDEQGRLTEKITEREDHTEEDTTPESPYKYPWPISPTIWSSATSQGDRIGSTGNSTGPHWHGPTGVHRGYDFPRPESTPE